MKGGTSMNQKPINAKGTKEINLGDLRVYENVVKDAIKCSKESDDKIIDASKDYLFVVSEVYKPEREILKEELGTNISNERKDEIYKRLSEISKEIIEASNKHDENFLKPVQQNQKEYNLKIVASVFALVTGGVGLAIKYKKPIIKAGQQILSTVQK